MSFTGMYLHYVWSTKERYPFLVSADIRNQLWDHMRSYANLKNIHLLAVGGHHDHCHCLVSLQADQVASKIVGQLKGESSFWLNRSGLIKDLQGNKKFEWQKKYYVESLSADDLQTIINYIQTQEEHHQKISFSDEVEKFLTEEHIPFPKSK